LKLRNAAQKAALETAQSYWSLAASLQKFALQDRTFFRAMNFAYS
jgi:hypothetical protein